MSLVQGDLLGGTYTLEELNKIYAMNQREKGTLKPNNAFYRKSMGEIAPTWA